MRITPARNHETRPSFGAESLRCWGSLLTEAVGRTQVRIRWMFAGLVSQQKCWKGPTSIQLYAISYNHRVSKHLRESHLKDLKGRRELDCDGTINWKRLRRFLAVHVHSSVRARPKKGVPNHSLFTFASLIMSFQYFLTNIEIYHIMQ